MEDLIYTFRLSIEQDRDSIVEAAVGAADNTKSIAKAKETILGLLNSFTPSSGANPSPETLPQTKPQQSERTEKTPKSSQKPAPDSGVKGFVLLNCEKCGNSFRAFLKTPQKHVSCKCGHSIDLTAPLAGFEFTCEKCGKKNWGKTNSENASIEVRCGCGEWAALSWSSDSKAYQLLPSESVPTDKDAAETEPDSQDEGSEAKNEE